MYFENSYQTEFQARILGSVDMESRKGVILDQTCFYPESGGQPYDTGFLDETEVVEVTEQDGEIVHWLNGRLPSSETVKGVVNRSRRFDHMQQHSGQHILSAAFLQAPVTDSGGQGADTVSFHLGDQICTIDINKISLSDTEVKIVEGLANQVIWENRVVQVLSPTPEQLKNIHLRKDPAVTHHVRVIYIADFDYSPCGGTHVSRTGEVGMIKIRSWEKTKGNLIRVEFVCGGRALRMFQIQNDATYSMAILFSSGPDRVPGNVEKMRQENKLLRKEQKGLRDQLLHYESGDLVSQSIPVNGIRLIIKLFQNRDQKYLRSLAHTVVSNPGYFTVFLNQSNETSLLVAASADLNVNSEEWLNRCISRFGGSGGGDHALAQGIVRSWDPGWIEMETKRFLTEKLHAH